MNTAIKTLRLHYTKREILLLVPLYILGLVLLVTLLVFLVLQRVGIEPSLDIEAARTHNLAIMWSLPGFLVYLGVQSVATTFPFGLALGADRRGYALGTLLTHATLALYLTTAISLLLLIELATNHWFIGAYVFDVHVIGGGRLQYLVPIVFLAALTLFSIGGAFGASWLRLGSKGPLLIGGGMLIVILLALLALAPALPQIVAAFEAWWLAVLAGVLTVLAVIAEYAFLRRAAVR